MYLISYIFFLISAQQLLADPCTTPNGKPGECVKLNNCPNLIKLFSNPNEEIVPFLEKYKCKSSGLDYWVCCNNNVSTTTIPLNKLSDRRYCGYQHSDDYFSETQESASIDEFPWLAAVVGTFDYNNKVTIPCEGSLINSRYILSVAHCFIKIGQYTFTPQKILLGEYNVKNKTDCVHLPGSGTHDCNEAEEYGIEKIITHPLYNKVTGLNDISLIRLDRKVIFTDYIRPICLPVFSSIGAKFGDYLYTTGWGKKSRASTSSEVKKKIKSTWLTDEECDGILKALNTSITDYRICTRDFKNGTEFSCQGDSGASVMYNHNSQWFLEGMVSAGTQCGASAVNMNTRVSKYLTWISENMDNAH